MVNNYRDELFHYGVPGMKWGQRKTYQKVGQPTIGSKSTAQIIADKRAALRSETQGRFAKASVSYFAKMAGVQRGAANAKKRHDAKVERERKKKERERIRAEKAAARAARKAARGK
ncbi:hypothetical protein [uncultured Actinomyces sp.]|uniref:DUF7211 domain-containing protein n=1 Tax=uncultured Actinomyces sp. TaxID=249061 RepID=UPI0028EEC33B|nr:hypothetical protein [uncultured Actinomyces sp.]